MYWCVGTSYGAIMVTAALQASGGSRPWGVGSLSTQTAGAGTPCRVRPSRARRPSLRILTSVDYATPVCESSRRYERTARPLVVCNASVGALRDTRRRHIHVDARTLRRIKIKQSELICGASVDNLWAICGPSVDNLWIICGPSVDNLWIICG